MINEVKRRLNFRIDRITCRIEELENKYGEDIRQHPTFEKELEFYRGMIEAYRNTIDIADDIIDEN